MYIRLMKSLNTVKDRVTIHLSALALRMFWVVLEKHAAGAKAETPSV